MFFATNPSKSVFPLTLNESGSYYLAENISTTGGGIVVQAHDVTIDLVVDMGRGSGFDKLVFISSNL